MVGCFHGMLLLSVKSSRPLVRWENTLRKAIRRTTQWANSSGWFDGRISPISAKDLSRLHQFGKKVLPRIFLGYALYTGRIWKGDMLVADIEELEEMDASEIHGKRLNEKEVLTPKNGELLVLPIADGTVNLSGGDQVLRTPTSIPDHPDRGEEQGNLLGE